jgi:Zn-dependent protease
MSWANYKDKVKRYFPFSRTEWNNFIILVLAFAFIWSFTQWGAANFDFGSGLKNFIFSAIMIAVIVFIHHSAQRLYGLFFGYRIEHKIWWAGLLACVLGVLLSNGKVIILAASAMQAHFLAHHRIGEWRYGPSLFQMGLVAFSGPIASVVIAFILQLIAPVFFAGMFEFSLLFALYCIIPIPPLDGVHVFAAWRIYGFVFTFTLFSILAFLILYFVAQLSLIWSIILALIIGFLCWLAFETIVD